MTKPVTVAAAMALVEEGRLALSDPVTRWVPELADMRVLVDPSGPLDNTAPAQRPITVDDLMTHRSGLAYSFSVVGPIARAYAQVSLRQDADDWLAEVARLPLMHQPGERLTYSHATEVLGHPAVAHRGQALAGRAVGAGLRATWHERHRVLRRPREAGPGRHHVPPRRDRPACATTSWAPYRSANRGSPRAAPVWSRPPTTTCASPGCCSAAARSTASGCSARSRCG